MPQETILIVDDAPLNLKLADILLRKEGYKVVTAPDAEQALAILNSLHPDLILIDIKLPGMNGLELTRRLKQNSETRDIVLVALTACALVGAGDVPGDKRIRGVHRRDALEVHVRPGELRADVRHIVGHAP